MTLDAPDPTNGDDKSAGCHAPLSEDGEIADAAHAKASSSEGLEANDLVAGTRFELATSGL